MKKNPNPKKEAEFTPDKPVTGKKSAEEILAYIRRLVEFEKQGAQTKKKGKKWQVGLAA